MGVGPYRLDCLDQASYYPPCVAQASEGNHRFVYFLFSLTPSEADFDLRLSQKQDSWMFSTLAERDSLPSTPSLSRATSPARALSSPAPTVEQIAMGLHVSRTPYLGADSPALAEGRVSSVQTISGTGANHLGALFLSRFYRFNGEKKSYISNPTWST